MAAPHVITIRSGPDIIAARMAARDLAREIGFNAIDQARIATATSELSRNILVHAGEGSVTICAVSNTNQQGIEIVFEDQGPGIEDVNQLLLSGNGFDMDQDKGTGLFGTRRLMDEMRIETMVGAGTKIVCRRWKR